MNNSLRITTLVLNVFKGMASGLQELDWIWEAFKSDDTDQRSTALGVVLNWVLATSLLFGGNAETADTVAANVRTLIEQEYGPIAHEQVKLATREVIYDRVE